MRTSRTLQAVVLLAGSLACGFTRAEDVDCRLGFAIANWLVKHQRATGVGTLRCSNNDRMVVRIKVNGRGITDETRAIHSAHAMFSRVRRIHDLLGTFVYREVHSDEAGAAHTQHLDKGEVGMTLTGKEGWDLGVTFDRIELRALPMKAWRQ